MNSNAMSPSPSSSSPLMHNNNSNSNNNPSSWCLGDDDKLILLQFLEQCPRPLHLSDSNVDNNTTIAINSGVERVREEIIVVRLPVSEMPGVMVRFTMAVLVSSFRKMRPKIGDGDEYNNIDNSCMNIGFMITATELEECYNGIMVSVLSDTPHWKSHREIHGKDDQDDDHHDDRDDDDDEPSPTTESIFIQRVLSFFYIMAPMKPKEILSWFQEQLFHRDNEGKYGKTSTSPLAIHVGRDTRESSESLSQYVHGVTTVMWKAVGMGMGAGAAIVIDHGEVTTPCLNFCVRYHHRQRQQNNRDDDDDDDDDDDGIVVVNGDATVDLYYQRLAQAYAGFVSTASSNSPPCTSSNISTNTPHVSGGTLSSLLVDCAGGIGFVALRRVVTELQQLKCHRRIVPTNRIGSTPLNVDCGAHHHLAPSSSSPTPPTWYNTPPIGRATCASLSGDGDRVVLFSQEPHFCRWHVLDMVTLVVSFLYDRSTTVDTGTTKDTETPRFIVRLTGNHHHHSNHDHRILLQNALGDRNVVIMTQRERQTVKQEQPQQKQEDAIDDDDHNNNNDKNDNQNDDRDAIIFDVDREGRISVTWSNHPKKDHGDDHDHGDDLLHHIQVLLNPYPDGIALMLLIDAILQVQNKNDWIHDWKRIF